jgi:Kef-type K+ transport system membrane component KefB
MSGNLPIVVVYEIGLLIVVASLSLEFFKRIRLPGLIGPILVGLVIGGPGGLGIVTNLTVIEVLGVLGAVLILFVVGLEFEASTLWKTGKTAFLITTGGVAVSLCVGCLVGYFQGWSVPASFLLGVVMAPSGTSVVASILNFEDKMDSKAGQTLLTACVLDDVEGVLLLTIALAMISERTLSIYEGALAVAVAVFFIVSSVYLGSRLFPLFISRFARVLSDEVFLAVFMGAGLIFAYVATRIGLAAITGAFLMGAVIPHRKIGEKLSQRLHFMKEIFAAVFFADIGLSINPFDIIRFFPFALLVCGTGIAARLTGGLIGGKISGFGGKQLAASVVGLAIRAEMSLIIAREGVATGVIGSDFLPVAATAVILSMVLITPVYSRLVQHL